MSDYEETECDFPEGLSPEVASQVVQRVMDGIIHSVLDRRSLLYANVLARDELRKLGLASRFECDIRTNPRDAMLGKIYACFTARKQETYS